MSSATATRANRERDGRIRLQPANSALKPLFVDPRAMRIQGVVLGVLRRY